MRATKKRHNAVHSISILYHKTRKKSIKNIICLLCTEKTADMCQRRLAAEYIASVIPDTEIIHL